MIGFILLALPIVVLSVAISYFALFLWGLKKNGQLNIFHRKEKSPIRSWNMTEDRALKMIG